MSVDRLALGLRIEVTMLCSHGDRKIEALKRKSAGLRAEFAEWRTLSLRGQPFARHNSQVRRIQSRLLPLRSDLREALRGATPEFALAQGRTIERKILAAHRIWEFFRAKLSQRQGRLAPFLGAADEFAWACYCPARECALNRPADVSDREPPLVFFNGGLSPFAVARDRSFRGEEVPNEPLSGPLLQAILRGLPVPVVGIPWSQRGYLPEALVIGHEVGHLVADDFGLAPDLADVLRRARLPADRLAAWSSWIDEVFADVYGLLAAGPGFVGSLIDVLSADVKTIVGQSRDSTFWGGYPTDSLRVLLNLQGLRAQGFAGEAEAMRDAWRSLYPTHPMTAFEDDLEPLIAALLAGPYRAMGDRPLTDVLTFTPPQQASAVQAAGKALANEAIVSIDPRVVFAALAIVSAAETPGRAKAEARLIDAVNDSAGKGVRGLPAATPEDRNAVDRALGESLARQLDEAFTTAESPTERPR